MSAFTSVVSSNRLFCALCGKQCESSDNNKRYNSPWCPECSATFDIKAIVASNNTQHFKNLFKFCTVCRHPYVFWKPVYHVCRTGDALTADWAAAVSLCLLDTSTNTVSTKERHVSYTSPPSPTKTTTLHTHGYWTWHY